MSRKYIIISLGLTIVFLSAGLLWAFKPVKNLGLLSPFRSPSPTPTVLPLLKYSIKNLQQRDFTGSGIEIGKQLKDEEKFSSYVFYYLSDGKKVSGLLNVPKKEGVYPVIVQFRGYVPLENYSIGEGTRHSGEVFASKGFITLAPDFLGYGESDMPSAQPLEERFQTYTAALNLLYSLGNLNDAFTKYGFGVTALNGKTGIWGHSNGGHIALTVLEIESAKNKFYPATLWAPVSKPFPYSILYYTDEADDHGKSLRKLLADFEKDYDAENYSLTNYLDLVKGPLQLHQGTADEPIPLNWTNELYRKLKSNNIEIDYFTYPGDDHNFSKGSWDTVVSRNIEFFKKYLQ